MKTIIIPILAFILVLAGCDSRPAGSQSESEAERFKSHQTQNVWTQLLLDTRTGKIWQVSKTEDDVIEKTPINEKELSGSDSSQNGRFTLTAMSNMWSFMLTDTATGKMWRCQFSMGDDPDMRYIEPVIDGSDSQISNP